MFLPDFRLLNERATLPCYNVSPKPCRAMELISASAEARHRYWSGIGRVDRDVLGQLIASQFIRGMPVWPSGREVYLVVHRKDTTILATDGLSDPDDGEFHDHNGFGIELFIEVP